ncbi:peptidoglycan-binding protein LysM [Spirochaetia bacterium]|nr:peptidoglycan-binding protein LysM [Spirochaetia bacterium]
MASTIGIKIANGEFYSLVEEDSPVKKRLVLTTVHNKQRSVQIDLYRSFVKTMADAQYIGSLVVENIKPRAKGEASIEMIISSTGDGDISAEAADLDTSSKAQRQSLSVSLKTLDEENRDFEIPDFDLDTHEPPPQGLYEKASVIKQKKSRKFPWALVIIIIVVLLLGGAAAVWYFVFGGEIPANLPFSSKGTTAQSVPVAPPPVSAPPAPEPASAPTVPVTPVAEAPKPAEPVQVIRAPAAPAPVVQEVPVNRSRRSPPVASYKVPSTIPKNGVAYKIRWGDTLWDISEAFYRNPWLYPRIARFNNIRNPDFIISGRTIRIPPRN